MKISKLDKLKVYLCKIAAKYNSNKTYPEDIDIDISEHLDKSRPIKVAIIDDQSFPWVEALEHRGCKVSIFQDYTKPIKQANQKLKNYDFSGQDIIICDIHGIGSLVYPSIDGIGVIEELRNKNPLHVIAAYTGNPGIIYEKIENQDCLDKVFSKEWDIDDFLINFDELTKIFKYPKNRWKFLKKRLSYIGISEENIDKIRKIFVENILIGKYLNKKFNCDSSATVDIIRSASGVKLNYLGITKFGINAAKLAVSISPFIVGDSH